MKYAWRLPFCYRDAVQLLYLTVACIGIAAAPVWSLGQWGHDSLSCEAAGAGALNFLHGSGAKAGQDGLLIASIDHSFSSTVSAECGLRVGTSNALPLLEKAAIVWHWQQSGLEAGFVTNRYGFDKLYRPHSIYNFLFEKPVLLNAYGFGATCMWNLTSRISCISGASLNAKESGQAHALVEMATGPVHSSLLAAFESYSEENQDNSLIAGLNTEGAWKLVSFHAAAKYADYLGYGHSANSTMVPGKSITGLLEWSYTPRVHVTLSALSYYVQTQKRFDHSEYFQGIEGTWMAFTSFGFGAGWEWRTDDNTITNTPRIFIQAIPVPGKAELRLSAQQTITGNSAPSYRLMGEVWILL